MNRRALLRAGAVAGGLAVAGCLERFGFEEQSAWRDPPLVADRPDAVYIPASTETMGTYGRAGDGEYAVSLSYTIPHRFWTVAGRETNRVTVGSEDTMHLMCSVWVPGTDHVLPVEIDGRLSQDGKEVLSFNPWPMLSQRMGFHYGDNVSLPGEGSYTLSLSVGPITARPVGEFEGRFGEASTFEIEFEYDRSQIHDVAFEEINEDRRGERGALGLMDHADMDGHDGNGHDDHAAHEDHGDHDATGDPGHPPTSRGPPVGELPGTRVGSQRTADAELSILETDPEHGGGDAETYLAVITRTPHNNVMLPFMSLSARIDGEEAALTETLSPELGHHYGLATDGIAGEVTVTVEAHPQVARHDGYETAFFEFDDVSATVGE